MAGNTNNSQFDFNAYNAAIKGANTGLKLHLGIQLIQSVVGSLEYFNNPLESELRPIYTELKKFRETYKERSAELAKKRENESERNANIDNAGLPQVGVAQMMQMMEQFQRMLAAQKAGDNAVATTAEESIKEIQEGGTMEPAAKTGTDD